MKVKKEQMTDLVKINSNPPEKIRNMTEPSINIGEKDKYETAMGEQVPGKVYAVGGQVADISGSITVKDGGSNYVNVGVVDQSTTQYVQQNFQVFNIMQDTKSNDGTKMKDSDDGVRFEEVSTEKIDKEKLWLQPKDVSNLAKTGPIPKNALKKLSNILFQSGIHKVKSEYKSMSEDSYWDELEILLSEWVQRYPNKATLRRLLDSLNEVQLHHLAEQLEKRKLLSSQKTKLSDTFKGDVKNYKFNLRKEKTIVTQLIPYSAVEDATYLVGTQRHKDITKLHVPRKYHNLQDGSITTNIEDLVKDNNNTTLIRAAAGHGKSTMYQYSMVQWANEQLLAQFEMMLALSCRDIKEGVIGNVKNIVFECSIIGDSGVDEKRSFTLQQMMKLAKEERLVTLVDGADEVAIPSDPSLIKKMKLKVSNAMEDPSIELTGEEIIVGFLTGVFLPGCQLMIMGRNASMENICKAFFEKFVPSEKVRVNEEKIIILEDERLVKASNFEILELEDINLKTLSHNILCSSGSIHPEDSNEICSQVFLKLVNIKAMEEFRRIPCFAKWLIELISYMINHGEIYDLNIKNLTTVIINLIFGRLREHSTIKHEEVESFCQLMESPKTQALGKGLQSLAKVTFDEMMKGNIGMEGTISREGNTDYIKIGEELLELEALKKMELVKISRSLHRKVQLMPEHLTLFEILSATHFCLISPKSWPSIIKQMPKERLLMVLRFAAGLLTTSGNELVEDYVKLMNGSASDKIQDLYQFVFSAEEDDLPATSLNDYTPIIVKSGRFTKTYISSKRLSVLALICRESQIKIDISNFLNNLHKGVSETEERNAMTMSVKLPSFLTRSSSKLTVSMKGETYLTSPADYKSLLFLETVTTAEIKYEIEELTCKSHLPPDISPEAMAGVISGTGGFWLYEYKGDVAPLLEVAGGCKPTTAKSMYKIRLFNTDITGVPPETLATAWTAFTFVTLGDVTVPVQTWTELEQRRQRGGLGRMDQLRLSGVDVTGAPDEAVGCLLASMRSVVLGYGTKLSDGAWKRWAEQAEDRFRNNRAVTQEVDVYDEAPVEELARIKASFKMLTIKQKVNAFFTR